MALHAVHPLPLAVTAMHVAATLNLPYEAEAEVIESELKLPTP